MSNLTNFGNYSVTKKATFICNNCKQEFDWEFLGSDGHDVSKNTVYVCKSCTEEKDYFTDNEQTAHKQAKHGFTFSSELEAVWGNMENLASALRSNYGLIATSDGSLPENASEFKTKIYQNLSGVKRMLEELSSILDFNDDRCGQHINIGHSQYINRYTMTYVKEYSSKIFQPVCDWLDNHRMEMTSIFGRGFSYYAQRNICREHEDAFNTLHFTHIEYRLCKCRTASQYFHLINLCIEITSAIVNNFIQYVLGGADVDTLNRKARVTANRIISLIEKYARGDAQCQSEERNSTIGQRIENILQDIENGRITQSEGFRAIRTMGIK